MKSADKIQRTSVHPEKSVLVPHQVGHLASSPGERHLVAYSPEVASITVISENCDFRKIELAQPTGNLCLSIDTTGSLLAFSGSIANRLHIRHIDSNQSVTIIPQSDLVDARFDGQGRLWTVRRGTDQFIVELRDSGSWKLLGISMVGDDYYLEGGAELRPGPSDDAMFVGVYSGQSEQINYLCEAKDGGLLARHISAMDGEQFVFIAPNGRTAVTLDHENCEIVCFSQPFNVSNKRIHWPGYVEDDCEDERPGYHGCFIDDGHFLAGSSEGRLFLIELFPFGIKKEIQVVGHEPVPASVKYPSLSDACGFVSDLLYFGRYGNSIAFIFAENHRSMSPMLIVLPTTEII